jgi:thiamine biosynthesis lipoprotein ApbE
VLRFALLCPEAGFSAATDDWFSVFWAIWANKAAKAWSASEAVFLVFAVAKKAAGSTAKILDSTCSSLSNLWADALESKGNARRDHFKLIK